MSREIQAEATRRLERLLSDAKTALKESQDLIEIRQRVIAHHERDHPTIADKFRGYLEESRFEEAVCMEVVRRIEGILAETK